MLDATALPVGRGYLEAGARIQAGQAPQAYADAAWHITKGVSAFAQGTLTNPQAWGAQAGLRWEW